MTKTWSGGAYCGIQSLPSTRSGLPRLRGAAPEETLERPLEEASEEECKTLSISLVPGASRASIKSGAQREERTLQSGLSAPLRHGRRARRLREDVRRVLRSLARLNLMEAFVPRAGHQT